MKHLLVLLLVGVLCLIWLSVETRRDIGSVLDRALKEALMAQSGTKVTVIKCKRNGVDIEHTVETPCEQGWDEARHMQEHVADIDAAIKALCDPQ